MQVRVLLFGPEADAAGERSVVVDAPQGCTCAQLRDELSRAHPPLRGMLASARFAVNADFASLDRVIAPSDEVALIGLVSGG